MKTRISTACLLAILIASPVFAQGQYLQEFYAGALHTGSISRVSDDFQNDVGLFLGAKTKFDLGFGDLCARTMYMFNGFGGHIWYGKEISKILKFEAGYFPRPMPYLLRPEPVSADGHFEPFSIAEIPGQALGTMLTVNDRLLLGLYQSGRDSLEYNFGIQQGINFLGLKSIKVAGYLSEHKSVNEQKVGGIAAGLDFNRLSLTFFAKRGVDEVNLWSSFALFTLSESKKISCFADVIKRGDKWQMIELAVIRVFSERVFSVPINYLLGAAYTYSELEPNLFKIYLQIWLDK